MKQTRSRLSGIAVGAVVLLVGVLAACGSAKTEVSTGGAGDDKPVVATPGAALTSGAARNLHATQELKVRQYFEPGGFDPANLFRIETENIAFNLYSGLTTFDPDTGKPMPDLAESWTVSPNGTVYTFSLVKNAEWHHGYGKVTSADVKYSYERVLDPKTGSPYRAELGDVSKIEAPDDYTVVITLKAPNLNFLYQVGNYHQGQIVKKEAIEKYGKDYPRNPVGTGPFYLESWTANSEMVLRAHPGYFRGKATLDKITLPLIKDIDPAATALINGEVDLLSNLGAGTTELIDRVAATKGVTVHKAEGYAGLVWLYGPNFEPFQKKEVRQAMAYAVDEKTIAAKLTPRTASTWRSIIPGWMPPFQEGLKTYEYDPEKAKQLLAAAGYPNGFKVKWLNTDAKNEANLLRQSYWAKVGIQVEFEVVEPTVFNSRRNNGDFDLSGRLYPAVNPDTLLFGYLHPDNAAPKGLNSFKYSNPQVTSLLEKGRAAKTVEEQKAAYGEVQKIIAEEVPYLAYSVSNQLWAGKSFVKNVKINRLANVDFYPVYIEKH